MYLDTLQKMPLKNGHVKCKYTRKAIKLLLSCSPFSFLTSRTQKDRKHVARVRISKCVLHMSPFPVSVWEKTPYPLALIKQRNEQKIIKVKTCIYSLPCCSLPIPHPRNLSMPHLFLQLKNSIHERLTRRRTTRNINIHRHNPIATPSHTI